MKDSFFKTVLLIFFSIFTDENIFEEKTSNHAQFISKIIVESSEGRLSFQTIVKNPYGFESNIRSQVEKENFLRFEDLYLGNFFNNSTKKTEKVFFPVTQHSFFYVCASKETSLIVTSIEFFHDNDDCKKETKALFLENEEFDKLISFISNNEHIKFKYVFNVLISDDYPITYYMGIPLILLIFTIITFIVLQIQSFNSAFPIHETLKKLTFLNLIIYGLSYFYMCEDKKKIIYGEIVYWKYYLFKISLWCLSSFFRMIAFVTCTFFSKGWMIITFQKKPYIIMRITMILSFIDLLIQFIIYIQNETCPILVINLLIGTEFCCFFVIIVFNVAKPMNFILEEYKKLTLESPEYKAFKEKKILIQYTTIVSIAYSSCSIISIFLNYTLLSKYRFEMFDNNMLNLCEMIINFGLSIWIISLYYPKEMPEFFFLEIEDYKAYHKKKFKEAIKISLKNHESSDFGFILPRKNRELILKILKEKDFPFIVLNPGYTGKANNCVDELSLGKISSK